MSTAGQSRVQQVKQLLGQLLLDRGLQNDKLGPAINQAAQLSRDAGGCLLSRPRRGVEAHYAIAYAWLQQLGVTAELPAIPSPEHDHLIAVERWREAEALLLAPHSMAALKQLPELQQLISFTAVQAVTAAGAPGHHAQIAAEAASKLCPASHASSSDVLQCMLETTQLQEYKRVGLGPEAQLFETLSPHMRLCLAADVAVGLLCPEQRPPPDTPEHAAALQVFLNAAYDAAFDECVSTLGGDGCGASHRLFDTFSGQLQHNSTGSSRETGLGILPAAGEVRSWPLAPLVDLQLQVPPQLLLQLVVKLQQQAQQPQAAVQHRGDSLAAGSQAVGQLMCSSISKAVHEPLLAGHAQQANTAGTGHLAAASPVSDDQVQAAVLAVLQPPPRPDGNVGFSEQTAGNIASLACRLVLQFLQSQLQCAEGADSAQWQQAVPLQALQLLAAVRHLEAAGHAAVTAAATAAAAAASQAADASAAHAADAEAERLASTAALQRIVHMLLSLLRQVRHYQGCNTAAVVQGASSVTPQQAPQDSAALPPHNAFAAGSEQEPGQDSIGLGLWWQPPELQTGVAAGTAEGAINSRGSSSSNHSSSVRLGGTSREQGSSHSTDDHAAIDHVLKVTAKVATHLQDIDNVLLMMLCSDHVQHRLLEPQHRFAELAGSRTGAYLDSRPDLKQQAQQVLSFLRSLGLELDQLPGIASCMVQPGALAATLHCFRQRKLCDVGAGGAADAWEDCIAASGGLYGLRQHSTVSQHSMPSSGGDWDDWGSIPGHSISLNGVNLRNREEIKAWFLDNDLHLGRLQLSTLVDKSCISLMPVFTWHCRRWTQTHDQHRAAHALCQLRQVANIAAACAGDTSCGTAGSAEDGKQRSKSQQLRKAGGSSGSSSNGSGISCGSSSSGGSSSTGSTDGSISERWVCGSYDWHPDCSMCQQEQSNGSTGQPDSKNGSSNGSDNRGGSSSSSSSKSNASSSPFLTFPVPYDDPFLYRRLLWRLLGKLSLEAQAMLAKHGHICPHHTDIGAWFLVCEILHGCMWSPPTPDVLDLTLSTHRAHTSTDGAAHAKQYSRALNNAFVRSYHPSTVLVSKQVLLALSPLHHQVMPPPDVAHLLPSSFTPAVGKALMQQLFEVPVLDGFQHQHCSLQLWHVWWHVGLRVYAAQQQQAAFVASLPPPPQQQQQQPTSSKKPAGKQQKGRGRSSSQPNSSSAQRGQASKQVSGSTQLNIQQRCFVWKGLSGADLEALYMDPQARLFAVGYATRQLLGLPQQPPAHAQRLQRLQHEAVDLSQRYQLDSLRSAFPSIEKALQAAQQADTETAGQYDSDTPHEGALWGILHAGQSMTDVLAVGQPELLAAVSGPRDLLIPPAQQKLQATAATNVAEFQAVCHYLGHCPPWNGAELYLDDVCMQQSQQQRRQRGLQPQQQGHGNQQQQMSEQALRQKQQRLKRQQIEFCDQSVHGPALLPLAQQSDVSQLMLQSPCPAEALGDPLVWWRWQQALLGLDTCDTCGAAKPARYRASNASLSPEQSNFPALAQLMHAGSVERGRIEQQLGCCTGSLSGLDGPTFPHGSSLVAPEDLIRAHMRMLKEGAARTRSGSNSRSTGSAGIRSTVKSSQREAGRASAQPLLKGTQLGG